MTTEETLSDIRKSLENVQTEVENKFDAAQDASKALAGDVIDAMRKNPVTSLAVAASVGFVLGALLIRRN